MTTATLQSRPLAKQDRRIDMSVVDQFRQWMPFLPPLDHEQIENKNPTAIFILTPPRSGSTLLRIILAGHPQLFSPPELGLLPFNLLKERTDAFSYDGKLNLDSSIHVIMRLTGYPLEQAQHLLHELEQQNCSTKQFYQMIQQWMGDKILVDKSPMYGFHPEILDRAERYFDQPLYIHLVRDPYATIYSFEADELHRYLDLWRKSPFSGREIAELVWLVSHLNILTFLEHIPHSRQMHIKFEDLVKQPQPMIGRICQFLKLDFVAEMLNPYQEQQQRMTDGILPGRRMVGDHKFYQHNQINPDVADDWKKGHTQDFLSELTWQVAESLGYKRT